MSPMGKCLIGPMRHLPMMGICPPWWLYVAMGICRMGICRLTVTFGDLSSIWIVWSRLVLLVTHVCAVWESYFQNAILGPTGPFVFEVIRICGSIWVHTCSRYWVVLPNRPDWHHSNICILMYLIFFLNFCYCLSSLMFALMHISYFQIAHSPAQAHRGTLWGLLCDQFSSQPHPFSQFSLNESFWYNLFVCTH